MVGRAFGPAILKKEAPVQMANRRFFSASFPGQVQLSRLSTNRRSSALPVGNKPGKPAKKTRIFVNKK
jgi:hypothetical protein